MKNSAILSVILLVVGLGVGFGGGYFFRNHQLIQARAGFVGAAGANGGFQRFAGARGTGGGARWRAVQGSILSMDAGSITVKLADGSTKIVLLSGSTTYSNTTKAAQTDLKTGANVAIFGTPNSGGSVTATNVQLNSMMFRPPGSSPPTP